MGKTSLKFEEKMNLKSRRYLGQLITQNIQLKRGRENPSPKCLWSDKHMRMSDGPPMNIHASILL